MYILLLFFMFIQKPLQTPTNCQCSYPLKTNLNWCKGSKGGEYCINKKGTKTYKPKR